MKQLFPFILLPFLIIVLMVISPVDAESDEESNRNAVYLGNINQNTEAITANDNAIPIDPEHFEAWITKGITLSKLGKYEESILAFDQAIKINPKDPAPRSLRDAVIKLKRYEFWVKTLYFK